MDLLEGLGFDREQRLLHEAYAFIRGLRTTSPPTAAEMSSAPRLLAKLKAEVPDARRGALVVATEQLLDGKAPGSGRREAKRLAKLWREEFKTGRHLGELRPAVYVAADGDVTQHPWLSTANALAAALEERPASP